MNLVPKLRLPVALVGMMALTMFAGCLDSQETESAVRPHMDVDRDRAWAGEDVVFDAQASEADSTITRYLFDFGDGETFETTDVEEARVHHQYADGGVYTATLTVEAEADDGLVTETLSETIVIDERHEFDEPLVAGPLDDNGSFTTTMDAADHAQMVRMNISFEDRVLVGDSRATVRLVDGGGDILYEESIAVTDEGAMIVESVPLAAPGDLTFEVIADSGAVAVSGALEIVYAAA